eukprot:3807077-Rhodomonas_salina.2
MQPTACAVRSSVLTKRVACVLSQGLRALSQSRRVRPAISLRERYAMSGTDIPYGATRQRRLHHHRSPSAGQLRYLPTRVLCDARY